LLDSALRQAIVGRADGEEGESEARESCISPLAPAAALPA